MSSHAESTHRDIFRCEHEEFEVPLGLWSPSETSVAHGAC